MSQFRKADSSVYTTFLDMIDKVFPELSSYSFGLLYREVVKKSKGGMIFAEVCQPTKLLSYFAKNDKGNPFDFLIIVDEMVWCCAKEPDRIRLMRHELRHISISEKGVPRMLGHDFEDFYVECDLNSDDPSWAQKLGEIARAGYDQVKAGEKDPRNDHQASEGVKPVTEDPQRQTSLPEGSYIEDCKPEGVTLKLKGTTEMEKKAAALQLRGKPKTVVTEIGKIRNKDNEIVDDDAEFEAGLEKGYGSA